MPDRNGRHYAQTRFGTRYGGACRACTMIMLGCALLLALSGRAQAAAQPTVPVGTLTQLVRFPSQYVAPHNVDVWLPPGYPKQAPYAVVYAFDGQNLFGQPGLHGGQTWRAAATAAQLIQDGKTRPFIIVGIWNAQSLRMSEYFPQAPWATLTPAQRRTLFAQHLGSFQVIPVAPYSDALLKFIVDELKPAIDQRFKVDPRQDSTFVLGSSMGGMMAWYALAKYPGVFSGAACLSTYWPGPYLAIDSHTDDPAPDAFVAFIRAHFPSPVGHKLYFDRGTRTLDAFIGPIQERVDAALRARGWAAPDFESRVFPGASHSEASWAQRLAIPLTFLLAPAPRRAARQH